MAPSRGASSSAAPAPAQGDAEAEGDAAAKDPADLFATPPEGEDRESQARTVKLTVSLRLLVAAMGLYLVVCLRETRATGLRSFDFAHWRQINDEPSLHRVAARPTRPPYSMPNASSYCPYSTRLTSWGGFLGTWARDTFGARMSKPALLTNVVFIKIHKSASGTIAGIFRRIGDREGLYGSRTKDICLEDTVSLPILCADHMSRVKLLPDLDRHSIDETNSVFFSSIREPVSRWLSSYYWFEGRFCLMNELKKPEAEQQSCSTVPILMHYFKTMANFSYHFHYMHPDMEKAAFTTPGLYPKNGWRTDILDWKINQSLGTDEEVKAMLTRDVMSHYSFVFVTTRVAESAVVLKHKLDLPSLSDVLYHSSKLVGDNLHRKKNFEDLPKEIIDFIYSDEFWSTQRYDRLLLELADEALNCEINRLGDVFQKDLQRFMVMMDEVAECPALIAERGTECYNGDSGCGYKCFNRVGMMHPDW